MFPANTVHIPIVAQKDPTVLREKLLARRGKNYIISIRLVSFAQ